MTRTLLLVLLLCISLTSWLELTAQAAAAEAAGRAPAPLAIATSATVGPDAATADVTTAQVDKPAVPGPEPSPAIPEPATQAPASKPAAKPPAATASTAPGVPVTVKTAAAATELGMTVLTTFTNIGSAPVNGAEIQIPLLSSADFSGQAILGEALNPPPLAITVDAEGRRTARFSAAAIAPGEALTIRIEYRLRLDGGTPQAGGRPSDPALLGAAPKIESDAPQIVSLAAGLLNGNPDETELARRICSKVRELIRYDLGSPAANKGALAALSAGSGVCEEYASLFVAIARAAGLPSRVVTGYARNTSSFSAAWSPVVSGQRSLGSMNHAWSEVYLSGHGWVTVDATYDRSDLQGVAGRSISAGTYIVEDSGGRAISARYFGGILVSSRKKTVTW